MKTFILWTDVIQVSAINGMLWLLSLQSEILPLAPWQHFLKRRLVAHAGRLIAKYVDR